MFLLQDGEVMLLGLRDRLNQGLSTDATLLRQVRLFGQLNYIRCYHSGRLYAHLEILHSEAPLRRNKNACSCRHLCHAMLVIAPPRQTILTSFLGSLLSPQLVPPRGNGSGHPRMDTLHLIVDLLGLGSFQLLPLTSLLRSIWARPGIHNIIPPSETTSIIPNETLMMNIMIVGTSPEWEEIMQAPRELVAAMRIDGLKNTEHNPNVHGEDMQVSSN